MCYIDDIMNRMIKNWYQPRIKMESVLGIPWRSLTSETPTGPTQILFKPTNIHPPQMIFPKETHRYTYQWSCSMKISVIFPRFYGHVHGIVCFISSFTEWFHPVFFPGVSPANFHHHWSSHWLNRESPCSGGTIVYRYDKVTVADWVASFGLFRCWEKTQIQCLYIYMCVCVVCLIIRLFVEIIEHGFRSQMVYHHFSY